MARTLRLRYVTFGPLLTGLERDEDLRFLTHDRIGNADHARIGHGGVGHQDILDLLGANAVAGTLDQIVLAGEEPDVPVLVHADHVTRATPALPHRTPLLLRIAPVDGPRGAPRPQLAGLAGLAILPLFVDHSQLVLSNRRSDRSGLDLPRRGRTDEDEHQPRSPKHIEDLLAELRS